MTPEEIAEKVLDGIAHEWHDDGFRQGAKDDIIREWKDALAATETSFIDSFIAAVKDDHPCPQQWTFKPVTRHTVTINDDAEWNKPKHPFETCPWWEGEDDAV